MKIISGGQTGIDRLGLEVATEFGIETGGTAPARYRTEVGSDYSLRDLFGLEEHPSSDYALRTATNVVKSDATLWIGGGDNAGYVCTKNACRSYKRPFIEQLPAESVSELIIAMGWKILNIAGPRGSRCSPEFLRASKLYLERVLSPFQSEMAKEVRRVLGLEDA